MSNMDDDFYDRADAHIALSNSQVSEKATKGKVSASFMYSVARYNAYLSATGFSNGQDMIDHIDSTIEYFSKQYKEMLRENLEDYAQKFDDYFKLD